MMIYDPIDVNICMNELGVLFYRVGDEAPQWVELAELRRNGEFRRQPDARGDSDGNHPQFRRPEW